MSKLTRASVAVLCPSPRCAIGLVPESAHERYQSQSRFFSVGDLITELSVHYRQATAAGAHVAVRGSALRGVHVRGGRHRGRIRRRLLAGRQADALPESVSGESSSADATDVDAAQHCTSDDDQLLRQHVVSRLSVGSGLGRLAAARVAAQPDSHGELLADNHTVDEAAVSTVQERVMQSNL